MTDVTFMPCEAATRVVASRRVILARATAAALATLVIPSRRSTAVQPAQLRIGGTGMALATIRRIAGAFTAAQPDVTVDILPSLGTGGGLSAVAAGAIQLALSARPLSEAESAKGLRSLAYARTPIAFVTQPDASVHAIILAEVARILRGQTLAWPNGTPLRLVRREPSDADWSMLRTLSAEMAEAVTIALQRPGLLTPATDQDNAEALERVSGAFGLMSIGQVRAEARGVMPLTLDGEPPTVEALAAGHYRLSRTLHIVWRDRPSPDIAHFLGFLSEPQTKELLAQLGHIALAGTAA